jgi:hypothetical protein
MSMQEIFNKVATHLLRQGQRSTDERDDCAYRGQGGLSCAVGCLIPDELYSPEFEYRQVRKLPLDVLEACGVDLDKFSEQLRLLAMLQTIHDNVEPRGWEIALRECARSLKLAWNIDPVLSK